MKCNECKANLDGRCKIGQYQHLKQNGDIGCRMHKATIERRLYEKKSLISLLR